MAEIPWVARFISGPGYEGVEAEQFQCSLWLWNLTGGGSFLIPTPTTEENEDFQWQWDLSPPEVFGDFHTVFDGSDYYWTGEVHLAGGYDT